jgi:hypothetical protein
MAKTLIKVTRDDNELVKRTLVLIDNRVLPFENSDEINVYIWSGKTYEVTVYCEGPKNASTTVSFEKAGGQVIPPLVAEVETHYGVTHSSAEFTVPA